MIKPINKLILFTFIFALVYISVSAFEMQYTTSIPKGTYRVLKSTGNESFYDVTFEIIDENITKICLESNFTFIDYVTKKRTYRGVSLSSTKYDVPKTLPMKLNTIVAKPTDIKRTLTKDNPLSLTPNDFEEKDIYKFCYNADRRTDYWLKFGNNSIIIIQESDVFALAVLDDVVSEGNFSHLTFENPYAKFDGDDDFINISNSDNFNFSSFTVSLWLKLKDNTAGYDGIVQKEDSNNRGWWIFRNSNTANVGLNIGNGIANSGGTTIYISLTLNEWTHLTFVFNGSNISNYKNGLFSSSSIPILSLNNSLSNVLIGYKPSSSAYSNSSIDEVMIYNRSLSSDEIGKLYNLSRDGGTINSTGLVGYYRFNNNDAIDSSGEGNDGIFGGGAETSFPSDNLVLYMPFDIQNEIGITYDYTDNDNDGIITGATFTGAGYIGGAYYFDGTGDVINPPNIPYECNESVFLWIESDKCDGYDNIIDHYTNGLGGARIKCYPNQYRVIFYIFNSSTSKSASYTHGDGWHHIGYVMRGCNELEYYIDGVSKGSVTTTNNTRIDTPSLWGISHSGSSFNGTIDEVMIFNTSLSASQILDIYNNQSARFKISGTQKIRNINISSKSNRIELILDDYEQLKGSRISARINYWQESDGYDDTDESLVACYHLDGDATDSCQSNDGTVTGATIQDNGRFGRAYEFNGTLSDGDQILLPSNEQLYFNNSENFSVMAWIYILSGPSSQGRTVLSTYDYQGMADDDDTGWNLGKTWVGDEFIFLICNGSGCVSASIAGFFADNLNRWVHTVGVFTSGKTIKLYINGNLIANQSTNIISVHASEDQPSLRPTIGRRAGEDQSNWNGTIDEVRIYNKSLTADEVMNLYVNSKLNYQNLDWQNLTDNNQTFDYASSEGIVSCYIDSELDSCGSNDGTLQGGASYASQGDIRNATLELDGDDDIITLPDALRLTGNVSVALWFKSAPPEPTDTSEAHPGLIGGRGLETDSSEAGFALTFFDGDNKLTWDIYNGSKRLKSVSTTTIWGTSWHFVVATRNSTIQTIYIDGVLEDTDVTPDGDIAWSATPLRIGYSNLGNFNGSIDEVAIWNRSLSASEISNIYKASKDRHSNNVFTINEVGNTVIQPEFRLNTGTNSFYTPLLLATLNLELLIGDCPVGIDWIINDGLNHELTYVCDITGYKLYVENGRLRINTGGNLIADAIIVNKANGGYAKLHG